MEGDPSRTCLLWGELAPGQEHVRCRVVESGDPPRAVPRVCTCECRTCERAWWEQGRPILRDGEIVRDPLKDRGPWR